MKRVLLVVALAGMLAGFGTEATAQYLIVRGTVNLPSCTAVDAVGFYAYVANSNGFAVVSMADPSDPTVLGQVSANIPAITGLEAAGSYAYCAGGAAGLVVVNIGQASQPSWVTTFNLSTQVRDVAVADTLVAVATASYVALIGVRAAAHPHILATYGRAASWIEFDSTGRRLHAGSTTGCFDVNVTVSIHSGDTTFSLSNQHAYGSDPLTPLAVAGSYLDVGRGAIVVALQLSDYGYVAQYQLGGAVRAVTGLNGCCFAAAATGGIVYLDQRRQGLLELAGSATVASSPTGLATGQSGTTRLLAATHVLGLSVLQYIPLAVGDRPSVAVPADITLQAFPNPFNPVVQLSLSVPHPGLYELNVYDALGRVIISDEIAASGTTRRFLDFSSHPSGDYWAVLRGETGSAAVRLVYIR